MVQLLLRLKWQRKLRNSRAKWASTSRRRRTAQIFHDARKLPRVRRFPGQLLADSYVMSGRRRHCLGFGRARSHQFSPFSAGGSGLWTPHAFTFSLNFREMSIMRMYETQKIRFTQRIARRTIAGFMYDHRKYAAHLTSADSCIYAESDHAI